MNEWFLAKVKYTAPHDVPQLIEAADAALALSREQTDYANDAMMAMCKRAERAEEENERLKCCGNCDHNGGTHCCHPVVVESGEYIETGNTGRLDRCQVQGPDAPSLWEPAGGLRARAEEGPEAP